MDPQKKKFLLWFIVADTALVIFLVVFLMSSGILGDKKDITETTPPPSTVQTSETPNSHSTPKQPTDQSGTNELAQSAKRLAEHQQLAEAFARQLIGEGAFQNFTVLGASGGASNRYVHLHSKRTPRLSLYMMEYEGKILPKLLAESDPQTLLKYGSQDAQFQGKSTLTIQGRSHPIILFSRPDAKSTEGFLLVLQYPENRALLLQSVFTPSNPADKPTPEDLAKLQADTVDMIQSSKLKDQLLP